MPELNRELHSTQAGAKPVSLATYALDTLALAILSNALIHLLLIDETSLPHNSPQGSTLLQALNGVVYLVYGIRLWLNTAAKAQLRYLLARDWRFWLPVAAVVVLACASALWSGEPQVTLRRALALAGTTLVGVFLALRYSPREFLLLLLGVSALFALSSIAMVVLWPQKGLMQVSTIFADVHAGRWRGIFLHKNHLASLMAVGIVTAAGLLSGRGRPLIATGITLLLCVGVMLFCESLTSLIATIVALLAVAALRIVFSYKSARREALIALFPLLLLSFTAILYQFGQSWEEASPVVATPGPIQHSVAAQYIAPPFDAPETDNWDKQQREGFRRDAGATGRTGMWRLCWDSIQMRPLQGFGYGAFWRRNGPAEMVWSRSNFHMPHAHNGWVDLALQLGIPMTLLAAGWTLWLGARLLRQTYTNVAADDNHMAITLFGLWVCLNVLNLAETILFRQHEILAALIFSVAVFATLAHKTPPKLATGEP